MTTQIRQQNGISILEPNGKIVGASILGLWETLSPQIEDHDTPRILIDFGKVHKIDSAGLGALLDARALTKRKNGRIGVINVGKNIRNILVLTRIVTEFEHFNNENDALAALSA
ncbi:hypothetical protein C6503_14645 [Candidatus Poribacteria bacterium]|nr:MAG: hypothetical protein C6503_14645 [Candidatus Poribacteria bacterium]